MWHVPRNINCVDLIVVSRGSSSSHSNYPFISFVCVAHRDFAEFLWDTTRICMAVERQGIIPRTLTILIEAIGLDSRAA